MRLTNVSAQYTLYVRGQCVTLPAIDSQVLVQNAISICSALARVQSSPEDMGDEILTPKGSTAYVEFPELLHHVFWHDLVCYGKLMPHP